MQKELSTIQNNKQTVFAGMKIEYPSSKDFYFFFKAKIFEIDCLFFLYIVLKQLSFTSLVVHVQKSVLELPEESL